MSVTLPMHFCRSRQRFLKCTNWKLTRICREKRGTTLLRSPSILWISPSPPPLSIELKRFRDLLEFMCSIPGVDWLQSWIQIGIIETIQNSLANRYSRNNQSLTPRDFYRSLGPMGQMAWRAVDKMWGTAVNDADE